LPFFPLVRLLGCAALFALCTAPAALAAPVKASTAYIISLGGVNVADLRIALDDNGQRYTLGLDADVTGIGSLVASGTATISASGRSAANTLNSETFDLKTVAAGEGFNVHVGYSGGSATEFKVTPPIVNNIDRVPVERSQLRGVTDMMSAFLIRGGKLDRALCDRRIKVFTGIERFDVAMSFAKDDKATSPRTGYQGPLVLCNIHYLPVSGHYTTSDLTNYLAQEDRILIWYAPLGESGYFIPYRVLMNTPFGDLSMVLTKLEQ